MAYIGSSECKPEFSKVSLDVMVFKAVSIEDKPILERWLSRYGMVHCNASVAELICGMARYVHEWCIYEDFFVLHNISDDNESVYFQPIGEGDLKVIIGAIEKDAEERGVQPVIYGATPAFVSRMDNLFPDWEFSADRRFADYLYDISDLKNLKGRKYHQKRLAVRKFASLYDFRYEELRPSMFEECIELEREWMRRKLEADSDIPAEELKKDLSDEYSFIETAFRYYEELEFIGGAIYVGDRLVAFTFASALGSDTICVHIEKADTDYIGVFAAIYNQFVLHLPDRFKFVDAEWDSGVPGLRLSKLTYHPVRLSEAIIGRKNIQSRVTASLQGS